LPYLQVQALPGLNTVSALHKIKNGQIKIQNFEFILLHVSTNEVENLNQCLAEFEHNLMQLTCYIKRNNPFVTMGVSGIVPRPRDWDAGVLADELVEHRTDMNRIISGVCERFNYDFLEIWSNFENTDGTPKRGLYANDMLHPNLKGINVLYDYYQGAMGAVMGKKYATE
jgi:hypothetical protein